LEPGLRGDGPPRNGWMMNSRRTVARTEVIVERMKSVADTRRSGYFDNALDERPARSRGRRTILLLDSRSSDYFVAKRSHFVVL